MSYWKATRHPAPCLLFVLPLLALYEYGVLTVGVQTRNGADAWMRWLLNITGQGLGLLAPAIIAVVLGWQALRRRHDAPDDSLPVLLGMALESMCCAMGLWAISRSFGPFLESLGVTLNTPTGIAKDAVTPVAQSVTFLGAGIYEEVIFRLCLFSGTTALLCFGQVPKFFSMVAAAGISAVSFAAVHHLGNQGEPVDGYVFAFRVVAGLAFSALYALRGFGITVGTHACYDVLVGIPL